jgi:hypothetical protein
VNRVIYGPALLLSEYERTEQMEYKYLDGHVYCRPASTPPVINSAFAIRYGIRVPCPADPGQFSGFEIGNNVKLRLVVQGGSKKMTCHAKIDLIQRDEATDKWLIGFGQLSLTDEEFQVLEPSFVEKTDKLLEYAVSVREKAREAEPVVWTDTAREIMRLKAVNFPVSVIEAIDENRGALTFSEFVTEAIRAYIKRQAV